MAIELAVSSAMVLLTVMLHAVGLLLLGRVVRFEAETEAKRLIKPLSVRSLGSLIAVVLGLFALHGLEIWIYAFLFLKLGAVESLREAVYFSTQTYAAIGYSDEALAPEWRIVGSIEGINGLLLLGWSTAFFITVMRRLGHA